MQGLVLRAPKRITVARRSFFVAVKKYVINLHICKIDVYLYSDNINQNIKL